MAMDLTTNLTMIGKRHPFLCNYKVGIDKNGKTIALKLSLYLDQGAAEDVGSGSGTLEVAFTNIDNCYKFPNFYVEGKCCKTNTPPNTYTRAPGWAQSVLFVEHVMEHIATFLNKTPESIKVFEINSFFFFKWKLKIGIKFLQQRRCNSLWSSFKFLEYS